MIALFVRPTFLSEPMFDLTVIWTLCDAADMLREGSGERALLLAWTEILDLTNYADGPAIRALGAVCLGSRALSGMCWDCLGAGGSHSGWQSEGPLRLWRGAQPGRGGVLRARVCRRLETLPCHPSRASADRCLLPGTLSGTFYLASLLFNLT